MALDLWLLNQHLQGQHPPTLRFYTWNPATISLGYHQRQWSNHWQQLSWNGSPVELVRRPTGGRAVLHQGDLTYAVITSGLKGNRVQVYQSICEFLIQGWRAIGVNLDYGQAGRGYIHNPNCFGTATGADLVLADGSKLIGSAQLRRGNAILQHGSIQLQPDEDLFYQVFGVKPATPKLPFSLPEKPLLETVMTVLTDAAIDSFGIDLKIQPLSKSEWDEILAQMDRTGEDGCNRRVDA
ncbi:lipoate--protein ligase family protein [Kovacikia minuta CCNUW1]|uniref:lipoate--protein ligase family protein n=1 Tax=Kovacikia minuta TaxID=2931930 RepID=UPI001CC95824|nr:biotin/lipoate A/B protein ligase family protein [Kovacikia minuta]UBF29182.1 lipoate--protein ligase family protein [Kovacikia minuta CCNUW1]